ncbi:[Pyruvate dehydrogenase [acetyl-transferring]]-phosphatase 1, mitochondrial [Coemansia sp. Benny D115]|nr:[Pyruvate dehydrogenase [acetyl-transferring]]-phosphatase 1, mitochondrial [Coemansia sp. Benny D115]
MNTAEIRQRYQGMATKAAKDEPAETEPQAGKPTGTKRSMTIAIGGVLTLLGVAAYSFMRQPTNLPSETTAVVSSESLATASGSLVPVEAEMTTALQSVATKREATQQRMEGKTKKQKHQQVRRLEPLTDSEVDAVLRANERSWEAVGGALRIDTDQVSSNDPLEDYMAWGPLQGDSGRYMVGVFDGHAGYKCAEQLAQRMQKTVDSALAMVAEGNDAAGKRLEGYEAQLRKAVTRLQRDSGREWDQVPLALTAAFASLDNDLVLGALAEYRRLNDPAQMDRLLGPAVAGSCGLVAVVDTKANEVVVANAGDSRALLGMRLANGTWKAVRLSQDHTGENPAELQRLAREHPGEVVIRNGRVLGALMPTRAFGDCRYKWPVEAQRELFPQLYARGHRYARLLDDYTTPPYVTARPVVVRHKLSENDKFVVVASDGLYDQMSDDDIVATVGQWYNARDPASGLVTHDRNAATHLIRAALQTDRFGMRNPELANMLLAIPPPTSRSYRDDISVAVVTLGNNSPVRSAD